MEKALGSSGHNLVNFKVNKIKIKTSCLNIQSRDFRFKLIKGQLNKIYIQHEFEPLRILHMVPHPSLTTFLGPFSFERGGGGRVNLT